MGNLLRFDAPGVLVHMDPGWFSWVSIKRFSLVGDGSDVELLATLIAERQYRDHYAGGSAEEQQQDELHGPYWLSAIEPATFVASSHAAAIQSLRAWVQPKAETAAVQNRVAEDVYPVLDAPVIYELPDMRSTAEHDWGGVVGRGGFLEYVAIDREKRTLTLMVASDD